MGSRWGAPAPVWIGSGLCAVSGEAVSSVGAAEGTALNNRATTSKAVDYCWLTWHTSWIIVCLCGSVCVEFFVGALYFWEILCSGVLMHAQSSREKKSQKVDCVSSVVQVTAHFSHSYFLFSWCAGLMLRCFPLIHHTREFNNVYKRYLFIKTRHS